MLGQCQREWRMTMDNGTINEGCQWPIGDVEGMVGDGKDEDIR
jgi:hypothetical protein